MSINPVEMWYRSGKHAQVNGTRVRPIQNPVYKDIYLSIQKGQAESICLIAEDKKRWILKKFLKGKGLERNYLEPVSSLLPNKEGFNAGTQRQILSREKLTKVTGCYYTKSLAEYLDNTILMPQIDGTDWSGFADDIRQNRLQLSRDFRIQLCRNLVDLIALLENNNCCHRDISSGNVFIISLRDNNGSIISHRIELIDFDSLYHPSLNMPKATTCGTVGYAPPYAWRGTILDSKQTWCEYADRYALAILIAEFLVLNKDWPLTAEGGMFEQDELRARSGPGLNKAKKALKTQYPDAAGLFEIAINSKDFQDCPSPQQWLRIFDNALPKPPCLDQLESIAPDYFEKILNRNRPPATLWSPPNLSEIPWFEVEFPMAGRNTVKLSSIQLNSKEKKRWFSSPIQLISQLLF